ncbi:MAG: hypothetical protein H6707_16740 [Deltaproteobacteria bacterium]|nr:hypothetical protein [Deltaproteobacteria bacterium]
MRADFLGQFLLRRGVISEAQLEQAVEKQRQSNMRIGDLAVDSGKMTVAQAEMIAAKQRQIDKRFGEIAREAGLLSEDDLSFLLDDQRRRRLKIGAALVAIGALTEQQLDKELEAFFTQQTDAQQAIDRAERHSQIARISRRAAEALISLLTRALGLNAKLAELEPICEPQGKQTQVSCVLAAQLTGDLPSTLFLGIDQVLARRICECFLPAADLESASGDSASRSHGALTSFIALAASSLCGRLQADGDDAGYDLCVVHDAPGAAAELFAGSVSVACATVATLGGELIIGIMTEDG